MNEKSFFFSQFTPEQMKRQYARNARALEQMHAKAIKTGKKVNGYEEHQLAKMVEDFKRMAK